MREKKQQEPTLPAPKPKHGRSNPKKFVREVKPPSAREKMGLIYLTPAGVGKMGQVVEIKEREKA